MLHKSLLFVLINFCFYGLGIAQSDSIAQKLAQEQLDGYNKRDIDAFLIPYADTVKVYMYPNQLMYQGKANMRQQYAGMFQQAVDLHCTLVKRIVLGSKVIDEESVVFQKGQPPMRAVAIYTIDKDKIAEVRFIVNQ